METSKLLRTPDWQSEDGRHRMWCGDCLELLPEMEAGSADAVVTDPPYNVGYGYIAADDNKQDYPQWCAKWFTECRRISSGAVTMSCGIVNLALWCAIEPPKWVICWWKPAAMGRSPIGFCNWEPMPLWGKPKAKGKCDVLRAVIKPDPDLEGHPCPKPLEWGEKSVDAVSAEGMTILDPFMGSGTTGVACVKTGRRFIGIEKERKYFDIAVGRMEAAIREQQEQLIPA